jgi:hypothetical protein
MIAAVVKFVLLELLALTSVGVTGSGGGRHSRTALIPSGSVVLTSHPYRLLLTMRHSSARFAHSCAWHSL